MKIKLRIPRWTVSMTGYKASFPWFFGIRKRNTFYKKVLKISLLMFIIELRAEKRNKDIGHSTREMRVQRDSINIKNKNNTK